MRLGTVLKRVLARSLYPGCQIYVNLASRRPVRYHVLWVGKDTLECVTKGGRVRRFRCAEVWLELHNGEGDEARQEKMS